MTKFVPMAVLGRIRRRLALAIVVTALIPVLVAIWLAESAIRQTSERFFMPEIGSRLDQSLELYQELARAVKSRMRAEAAQIATEHELREAALRKDSEALRVELERAFSAHPSLVSLSVAVEDETLAATDRGRPLDPEKENRLRVELPLASAARGPERALEAPQLVAVFAAEKARFDQLESMSQFVNTYRQVAARRREDERSYIYALALLLGITILASVGVGSLLARGVTTRIDELAEATQGVAAGDLSVRVSERGNDEITDFARAFNRMLAEVESSRARIEYLQRIGAWQEMARRLAHEIKNPLTPIQLAVQEVHRRYPEGDVEYKKLLDTTLEIVEDEVGTLRRLVSEFSNFARLPQAQLEEADLSDFLNAQRERLSLGEEEARDAERESILDLEPGVAVTFRIPDVHARVYLDRQMFRRALINLIRNGVQAVQESKTTAGEVRVSLEQSGQYWEIHVDDNGPGIDNGLAAAIFDPYVTGKRDGTGLGLAIVKKIVIEHGGTVQAVKGPLGGARLSVRLPALGTSAAKALSNARQQPRASAKRRARRSAPLMP